MRILYILLIIFAGSALQGKAQTITGRILDGENHAALTGVTIREAGTDRGEISDEMGKFEIRLTEIPAVLEFSFLGYKTRSVEIREGMTGNIGDIYLTAEAIGLEEVVVTGVMDIVQDRRTPVAVSDLAASTIRAKAGANTELPEVAKATPSVYMSAQAGGYGEGEVFTRGFDQTNTAFMINGQPVNGMDNGRIYWSNWSGLADVASAIQIQRGLGASRLAISSVGGTWNFVLKSTDTERGGNIFTSLGTDRYQKAGASYSTGLIDDRWGMTVLAAQWSGDGWADGTQGSGQTYFISAGYRPGRNHKINFLVTGAPQSHDQNFGTTLRQYQDESGKVRPRFNNNWGNYDGRYFTERVNYYHKPVANLNWDWEINEKSAFSAVLYGSLGRGGGTGGRGTVVRTDGGLIDFDATAADPDLDYFRHASVNNHNWFGSVLSYEQKAGQHFHFNAGADLRHYFGDHFRQVNELMSKSAYEQWGVPAYPGGYSLTDTYKTNPWAATFGYAPRGERIDYNSAETIRYAGVFGQAEFLGENFTAYLQGAFSGQDYRRHDYFYVPAENAGSERAVKPGHNLKSGLSYSLTPADVVFANAGWYSRQPFFEAMFVGNSNEINEFTRNEDIQSLELGYRRTGSVLRASLNFYHTAWRDRAEIRALIFTDDRTVRLSNDEEYIATGPEPYELIFKNQLHTGLEAELEAKISDRIVLRGVASVGRWDITGKQNVELYDGSASLDLVRKYELAGEDMKVGGAPQTSFHLGVEWRLWKNFYADAGYFYYDRLYAVTGGLRLPSFQTIDVGLIYRIPLADGKLLQLTGNVYNLANALYISQAFSSLSAAPDTETWRGVNTENTVIFGPGRTGNLSLKYSF